MRFISIRSVFLALVAVFAMSAVTAAAASALAPEFKPSTKQAFTGTAGAVTFSMTTGEALDCTSETSHGEVTGAKTVNSVVLTFTGCYVETSGGTRCSWGTPGDKTGEFVTKALKGELGEVAKTEAASGVGLLLKPESGTHDIGLIEAPCLPETYLEGDVVAEVTPTKTSAKTLKLVFVGKSGGQAIKFIMKGLEKYSAHLEFEGVEALSVDFTETFSFEKALEVT